MSLVYGAKGMKFCIQVSRTCVHKQFNLRLSFICINRVLDASISDITQNSTNQRKMSSKSAIFKRKWLITNMLKYSRNTNNSGIRFISRFTMNNISPKLQKCWTLKIASKTMSKMLSNQISFTVAFYTCKGRTCKVLHFQGFWFMFYDKFYPIVDFLRIFSLQNREL